jgi:hypothetical protein
MMSLGTEAFKVIVFVLRFGKSQSTSLTTIASLKMLSNDPVSLLYDIRP